MAGYAGACHRAARCADPVGFNPPCEEPQRGQMYLFWPCLRAAISNMTC